MKPEKHTADRMTPVEREYAIEHGLPFDRIPSTPFIGSMGCLLLGITEDECWNYAEYMVNSEIAAYNRFGFDRLNIGPNTKGISTALKLQFSPENLNAPVIDDYKILDVMEPVDAFGNPELTRFMNAAEMISEKASDIVPIKASIGGPFTIASFLRGIELLLRDCRRNPQEIHQLMRIIVDSQKSCVDRLSEYNVGIAMADPVANPSLIGPKLYETFVFPYTKELTDYVVEKTGKKVSLHMCGETYRIWKYFAQYKVDEISLDNVVDLERAAMELGEYVPIAGNADPVNVIMRGTKEKITEEVISCIEKGKHAKKGYRITSGCDIPNGTAIDKMDWFMEAVRKYGR